MRPKAPGLKYLITYHKVSMLNFPDSISQIINKPSQITLANFRKKIDYKVATKNNERNLSQSIRRSSRKQWKGETSTTPSCSGPLPIHKIKRHLVPGAISSSSSKLYIFKRMSWLYLWTAVHTFISVFTAIIFSIF